MYVNTIGMSLQEFHFFMQYWDSIKEEWIEIAKGMRVCHHQTVLNKENLVPSKCDKCIFEHGKKKYKDYISMNEGMQNERLPSHREGAEQ